MSYHGKLKPGELLHRLYPLTNTVADRLSYTTLLTNGSTWTSSWVDVSSYSSLVVAVKTDQDVIFYVDFSPDGTNVDSTLTRYYNNGQIEAPHRYTITRQFARIRFTNDSGSDQTYFRLQTLLGDHVALNTPIDGTVARDFDAVVVRPTEMKHEIGLGLRQGVQLWNKFGYNDDIDTATDPEIIASFGGTYTPPTSASTLTIVSSSTDDDGDPAGTGANSVIIYGIDANRDNQIEQVTLDGTTNVVTTSTWLGINRMSVALAGSGKTNAGAITCTATTGGATLAQIPAGEGTSQQCIYHTPRDAAALATLLTVNFNKSGGGTPTVTVKGFSFSPVSNCTYEVFRYIADTSVENSFTIQPDVPFVLAEQDVFYVTAETTANDTSVNARFSLYEYKKPEAE